ncbi:fimbrial protein [Klebsiella quasipneumoniae]|uniref:fimbrial protein n=1 Tax=Klebsiella quasipneumoniae TaxID=1463165 RepID=UPI0010B67518|nr:fimbrial protein [Klebsiella quasipneumoniae]VGC13543.1 Fimbrial adhesin [Klebsiella quasipneumoniae]
MKRKINMLLIMIFMMIFSRASIALVKCENTKGHTYKANIAIGADIFSGNEIPVGTILYSLLANTETYRIELTCATNEKWVIDVHYRFLEQPKNSPIMINGKPVYETNVKGVGVAVREASGNNYITWESPFNKPFETQGSSTDGSTSHWRHPKIYYEFIKTGPISGSTTLNMNSVPDVAITAIDTPGYSGLPIDMLHLKVTGNFHIHSSTCKITNTNSTVLLGEHAVNNELKGIDSTTPWVNASIELSDCPQFFGYYSEDQISTDGNKPTEGAVTSNKIRVDITAHSGFIDESKGIFSIDNSDPQSASGVGIQLGGMSGATIQPLNLEVGYEYPLPNNASKVINIPLFARYYQVTNKITPGTANGVITYTINYQ